MDIQDKTTAASGPFRMSGLNLKIAVIAGLVLIALASRMCSKPPAPLKPAAGVQDVNPMNQQAAARAQEELAKQIQDAVEQKRRAEQFKAQAELDAAQIAKTQPAQLGVAQPQPAGYTPSYQSAPVESARPASNVALSYRANQNAPMNSPTTSPTQTPSTANAIYPNNSQDLTDIRALIESEKKELAGMMTARPGQAVTTTPLAPGSISSVAPSQPEAKPIDPELQASGGPKYRVFEGTEIETVLTNRLNGSFAGPVNVLVTTDVYSHDHQVLLIPQGTRILGEAQRVNATGQQRLAVVFHRIIMPDGYSESLDQFLGLNQIGETGLKDKVDNHLLSVFGTSVALGLISGFSIYGTGGIYTSGGIDAYRQGIASSMGQSGQTILQQRLNVLPTITIREGHRIKVYIRQDIQLPAYANHKIRSDI